MAIRKPFGRVNEAIGNLTEDQRLRAATKASPRLGGDVEIKIWSNRSMLAKIVRQQERSDVRPRWNPVVKLSETEGYS